MAREINGSDPRDGAGDRPAVRNHAGVLALVSACFGAFERHHSTWTPRLIGAGPAAIASPGIGSAAERGGAAFLGEGTRWVIVSHYCGLRFSSICKVPSTSWSRTSCAM